MFTKMRYVLFLKMHKFSRKFYQIQPFSSLDNTTQPAKLLSTIILMHCKRIPKDNERRSI
jgi:hypothetical protein